MIEGDVLGRAPTALPKHRFMINTYGQEINSAYRILTDPLFERRLKSFDPRLKLMFDQSTERWVILEEAYDNTGWNCIIKCENPDKTPRPLGDWVFAKLHAKRQMYELKRRMGSDSWMDSLISEAKSQKQKIEDKNSQDHQLMIKDDLIQWRKASKEIQNQPASDAVAGYRKV